MILHEFYTGRAFEAYEYFGAHPTKEGVVFRVYAPGAERIEVIGEFNDWDGSGDEMKQEGQSGIFEAVSKEAKPGMMYKFRIYQKSGRVEDRFDPYGFGSELRPNTAAIIRDIDSYTFHDGEWMRKRTKNYNQPLKRRGRGRLVSLSGTGASSGRLREKDGLHTCGVSPSFRASV